MAEDSNKPKNEKQTEFKIQLRKSVFGIVIGIAIGVIFGLINDNFIFGITCGSIIGASILLVVTFPAKMKQRVIFLVVYLVLIIALLAVYFSSFNSGQFIPAEYKREVPAQILDNFKVWSFQASLLRLLHILLGLLATVCSILVAMEIKKIDGERKKWLAFTAAVSFSILSAFDLGDKANRTRTAWREMNTALIKYQEGIDTSKANLIDKYEEAEKIIGDVKPSPKDNIPK